MRPIHVVTLDKARPALILTRSIVRDHRIKLTVAPITSTVLGLSTEVPVGPRNGLDHDSVISCDNILTLQRDLVGRLIGYLLPDQEMALAAAIRAAFDLE